MTPGPKAIETVYNGYRFRSRVEARWAVFFDALGVPYEYEKEGFDLGEVGWYLPDFWLPTLEMWAEVKGVPFSETELARARALADSSGHEVLRLVGTPEYTVYWATCPSGHGYASSGCGSSEMDYLLDDQYVHDEHRWFASPGYDPAADADAYDGGERTQAAYAAARQARFEHGERPNVPVRMQETATFQRLQKVAHQAPAYVCAGCELPITGGEVTGFDLSRRTYYCDPCALAADRRRNIPEEYVVHDGDRLSDVLYAALTGRDDARDGPVVPRAGVVAVPDGAGAEVAPLPTPPEGPEGDGSLGPVPGAPADTRDGG